MSDIASGRTPRERQVDALIAQFEQAAEQGHPLNQADFLTQNPEFAAELREYFDDVARIVEAVQPHRLGPDETDPLPGSVPGITTGTKVHYVEIQELVPTN